MGKCHSEGQREVAKCERSNCAEMAVSEMAQVSHSSVQQHSRKPHHRCSPRVELLTVVAVLHLCANAYLESRSGGVVVVPAMAEKVPSGTPLVHREFRVHSDYPSV